MAGRCLAARFVVLASINCVLDMDFKWVSQSAWGANLRATMVFPNKALKVSMAVIRRAACGRFRHDWGRHMPQKPGSIHQVLLKIRTRGSILQRVFG